MVVDVDRPPGSCQNILVPVSEDPHSERALQIGRELADRYDGTVTAFYVGEADSDDALPWAQRRLTQILEKTNLCQSRVVRSEVRVADERVPEWLSILRATGMALVSATHDELLEREPVFKAIHRGGTEGSHCDPKRNTAGGKNAPVLKRLVAKVLPHLTRDARLDLLTI